MFQLSLFRIRAFTAGNIAGLAVAIARGGLQFMLIIWLQGIWLPLHGYDYSDTPFWAGIFLLPLTAGILISGPVSGILSDRFGARGSATAGMVVFGASFIGLMLLPVDFPYWAFALLTALNGSAAACSPRPTVVDHEQRPGQVPRRGIGMRSTYQNSGTALSIGVFFSLMIVGLASTLPRALAGGLQRLGVPHGVAHQIGSLPPVSSLFARFSARSRSSTCWRPGARCRRSRPRASGSSRQAVLPGTDIRAVRARAVRGVRRVRALAAVARSRAAARRPRHPPGGRGRGPAARHGKPPHAAARHAGSQPSSGTR